MMSAIARGTNVHLKALARYTFNFRDATRGGAFMPVGWAKDALPPRRERESGWEDGQECTKVAEPFG